MQMADEWSKDKILTTYLNIVPYGGVTYGCEAAAEVYFSTHCDDLGITQAAMIAGLPQSPTKYNPNLHPARRARAPKRRAAGDAPKPRHQPTPVRVGRRHHASG